MSGPFGATRTHVEWNHALIAADGHVPALPPSWGSARGYILVSPAMNSGRGPRFCQYLVEGGDGCQTHGAADGLQRLVYVLAGTAEVDGKAIAADDFVYFPAGDGHELTAPTGARLLVFEKPYEPVAGLGAPLRRTGSLADAPTEPFLGDPDALLSTLLPIEPEFDMAVNVFTFKPGATLPFVETHVMEHGLYMRAGQGVYRLADKWYPVQQGDAIWMASYCPQWFVATGKSNASYVYYKDVHRDPLGFSV